MGDFEQERVSGYAGTARLSDFIMAVDVGTGSARAALFDSAGAMLGRAEHPIRINRPEADCAEQDSEDIWRAVCSAVQGAVATAGAAPARVRAISFDGTCSLVVRDRAGRPLSVSASGLSCWDTLSWLDHRAQGEAMECTATGHPLLGYFGGVMSPEMEIPKLMWLKRQLPERWAAVGYLFDLDDCLTWRASGSLRRSQCTLTCKWAYLGHERAGWQGDFLDLVGLGDLLERGRLPETASPIGADLGPLTALAARDLGLSPACRVGMGLIDAHAGVLGSLAGRLTGHGDELRRQATLITGTSSSVMALSAEPRPITGVWGPYFGAVLPTLWLYDAGQSASGALLDHIVRWHAEGGEPDVAMHRRIAARILALQALEGPEFAKSLHVLPDFHGNRSPLADPRAVGVISGLDLDRSFDSLCRLYWRTAAGIALGLRHILEHLNDHGHAIDTLHVVGGHTRSSILTQLYADATGCVLIEADQDEAVLRGTAAVAATAAGLFDQLDQAAARFSQAGRRRLPDQRAASAWARDYRVFLEMHEHRRQLDAVVEAPR
jgi:FGGY-family pentulose kinase